MAVLQETDTIPLDPGGWDFKYKSDKSAEYQLENVGPFFYSVKLKYYLLLKVEFICHLAHPSPFYSAGLVPSPLSADSPGGVGV